MPGFEVFGDEERSQVHDVLENGVLMRYGFDGMRNGHWKALEFEKAFALRMGTTHCQLVSSGTAALTVALAAAGVGAGDEVIMPVFTFVASFESILMLGAIPVLVDIDATLGLDPTAVAAAITPKTKCIMPVHMCGSMADLKALAEICNTHKLLLLEDACQAIGGTFAGKPLGSIGDLGCFSFDFVKTITCGEGGGIITNNDSYKIHADQFQDHGHDHLGNNRGAETHPTLGYNFRISELNAAVGIAQLGKFDAILEKQEQYYTILANELASIPEVIFRKVPEGGVQNHSFVNFFLPTQEIAKKVHTALGDAGVEVCFYWFDNNWHYIHGWEHLRNLKSFQNLSAEVKAQMQDLHHSDFSKSDAWMGRTISSLVKIGMTEKEVKARALMIKDTILKVLNQ